MPPSPATVSSPLLLLLAACATSGGLQQGPVDVEAMNTWVEKVHIESARAREAIGESLQRLNTLAAGKFDRDPATIVYARFVQAIDVADQATRHFRGSVGPMQQAALPIFEQWEKNLTTIGNERLRQRGQMRCAVAKERYEAIAKVAVPAQDGFEQYVKGLRDLATFLAHDLNAAAIDDIQDEVKLVQRQAHGLDRDMQSCAEAARAYVEQATLPSAPGR